MDDTVYKELKIQDLQILASILFIISIIVSIILSYNEKLKIFNEKTIFNTKQKNKTNIYNKVFVVILLCIFLYCSYENYKINFENGDKIDGAKLQVIVSLLVVFTGFLALYIAINYQEEDISYSNNPI